MARVLVVDDDPDILRLVQMRLAANGHAVLCAGSAAEAFSVLETSGAPDVVVLDVGLPGTDGLELLQQLRDREELAGLPAVFLSARVSEEDVARGRALGATYLTKPFVATALLTAIDRALPQAPPRW